MKFYQAITILILISYIYAASYCDTNAPAPGSPTKAEDCSSHKANSGYCCLVKEKSGNLCSGLGPNEYKYVKDYVKYSKKCYPKLDGDCEEYKDFSIDCKSSYLVLSLFSLILLFL
jgi:hypothetical protein